MAIKSDRWIKRMALEHKMIEPFVESQTRNGVVSFGVSSYGYDVRVGDEFKVFTNVFNTVVDPKNFDPKSFVDIKADVCIIPPNSFALASTIEYFRIPRDILTVCLGKSTYARCGIIVNVTPFEPEWEGHVTIEISNTTPLPAKIYANEGIAQRRARIAERVVGRRVQASERRGQQTHRRARENRPDDRHVVAREAAAHEQRGRENVADFIRCRIVEQQSTQHRLLRIDRLRRNFERFGLSIVRHRREHWAAPRF